MQSGDEQKSPFGLGSYLQLRMPAPARGSGRNLGELWFDRSTQVPKYRAGGFEISAVGRSTTPVALGRAEREVAQEEKGRRVRLMLS